MAITKRQRQVYDFIAEFVQRNQYSPSFEEIGEGLGLSSLATVHKHISNLEKKGLLKHEQEGVRYMYSATISPSAAKRNALQQYLQTFFGGSLRKMMTALVAEERWTDEELDALKAEIDRVRRERNKKS